jgi:hypothetical protein
MLSSRDKVCMEYWKKTGCYYITMWFIHVSSAHLTLHLQNNVFCMLGD